MGRCPFRSIRFNFEPLHVHGALKLLELPTPVGVWIPQALDIDAAREAAFNRCLDELGSKEREREREIDLPFGASLALCQLLGASD